MKKIKKIEDLKDKASMTKKQVERLQGQIEKLMQERGISVDEQLNEDLQHTMSEQKGEIHKKFSKTVLNEYFGTNNYMQQASQTFVK